MAKRQHTPQDLDETVGMDDEDVDARNRETNEGGPEDLDDEDTDVGANRPHPKKK